MNPFPPLSNRYLLLTPFLLVLTPALGQVSAFDFTVPIGWENAKEYQPLEHEGSFFEIYWSLATHDGLLLANANEQSFIFIWEEALTQDIENVNISQKVLLSGTGSRLYSMSTNQNPHSSYAQFSMIGTLNHQLVKVEKVIVYEPQNNQLVHIMLVTPNAVSISPRVRELPKQIADSWDYDHHQENFNIVVESY